MRKFLAVLAILFASGAANATVDITNPLYGAVCDGTYDDTVAIQAAIVAAQSIGDEVYFPPGSCKVTSSLAISGRVKLRGVGYQGDSGGGFAGHGVSQSAGFKGSVIVCAAGIDCVVATTNLAVQIQDLQITYPSGSGKAVTIQAVSGAGNANTQSSIRGVMITGGSMGVVLINCLNFHVTQNHILYQTSYGIVVNSPNFPNYEQAFISGNMIWGAGNSGYQAHMLVQAGGDLVISGNKMSVGGVNTNSIALFGAPSGTQYMEPMVITGNSTEGAQNGITFNTGNSSFYASQVVVTGNQIWAGSKAILVNTFGTGQWLLGFTITGNVLCVNGGSGKNAVQIDNASGGVFTGNSFCLTGGGSSSTGIILGSHTTNVNVQSNVYEPGFSTKVSNLGSGNTVGGGSP